MIKILFVDDEQNILDGLQRLLRPMRREWDMQFVDKGIAALELLGQVQMDVVVSDIKMPDMDGVQFLSEVRKLYPSVIRVALSGHADRKSVMESLASTHRFLPKPCDPETLKSTVATACALREMLGSENLRTLVSGLESLPIQSSVGIEIEEELSLPEPSVNKIAAMIERDPAITAKILHMANSAYFGMRQKISSLVQAVSVLGFDSVKMLLTVNEIFLAVSEQSKDKHHVASIYEHSLRVGMYVRELAKTENLTGQLLEESLAAGLLHDVGKLVLSWQYPKEYAEALLLAREQEISSFEAEREIFGATHAEVGAFLLGLWGLPESIVEVMAFHHKPSQTGSSVFGPITLVHYANAYDLGVKSRNWEIDMDYINACNLSEKIATWQEVCDEHKTSALPRVA